MSTRKGTAAFAVLVAAGVMAVPGTAGTRVRTQSADSFRLADGSAACKWQPDGSVACRSASGGASLVLAQDGSIVIGGPLVTWSSRTPVLRNGQTAQRGAISCRAGVSLVCSTASGGRLEVAARGAGALVPPVSHTQP